SAESFAHDERNLWHGCLNTGECKLSAAVNKPDLLLLNPGHIARRVHDEYQSHVVGIADLDKPCAFIGRISVNTTRQVHGVIRYESDCFAVDAAKSRNHIRSEIRLQFDDLVNIAKLL